MPESGKCPECGKKNLVRDRKDPAFCDKVCRANYQYKQRFITSKRFEK